MPETSEEMAGVYGMILGLKCIAVKARKSTRTLNWKAFLICIAGLDFQSVGLHTQLGTGRGTRTLGINETSACDMSRTF